MVDTFHLIINSQYSSINLCCSRNLIKKINATDVANHIKVLSNQNISFTGMHY